MKKNWKWLFVGLGIVGLGMGLLDTFGIRRISEKEVIETTAAPLLAQLVSARQSYLTVEKVGQITYVKVQGNSYLGSVKMVVYDPSFGGSSSEITVNFTMLYDGKTVFVQLVE